MSDSLQERAANALKESTRLRAKDFSLAVGHIADALRAERAAALEEAAALMDEHYPNSPYIGDMIRKLKDHG